MLTPYYFVQCQLGMQTALRQAIAGPDAAYRPSFSRGGWLTLKGHYPTDPWSNAAPRHPLVRCSGHVINRVEGSVAEDLVRQSLELLAPLAWETLHVWQPDPAAPGSQGFEPGPSLLSNEVAAEFRRQLAAAGDDRASAVNIAAKTEAKVADVVLEQPGRWWVGTHVAAEPHERWPGGVPPLAVPLDAVSRAYLKAAEAATWADLPLRPGQRLVEIGSSPGGSCQYYLERGLEVTGVDPADMDPAVAEHPKFTHVRSRAIGLKRRFFGRFHYLACDANVAPNYTLDTVEAVVTHPSNRCRGVVLTLKLAEPEAALELPAYLERLRAWPFEDVRARQLAYNRREITVVLQRRRRASSNPPASNSETR